VVDTIKVEVEASCKATLSCTTIIILVARDVVNLVNIHLDLATCMLPDGSTNQLGDLVGARCSSGSRPGQCY
jgi:hypothetical protein